MKDKTDICSAIEEAGAVEVVSNEKTYAFAKLDENGCLVWYDKKTKEKTGSVVALGAIRRDIWQPYHEVKEIRPEREGELWKNNVNINWFIRWVGSSRCKGFQAVSEQGVCFDVKGSDMIHGKGWTRLFPEVEDDSVESDMIKIPSGYKRVNGGFMKPDYLIWCREEVFESVASGLVGAFGRVETYSCVIEPDT